MIIILIIILIINIHIKYNNKMNYINMIFIYLLNIS